MAGIFYRLWRQSLHKPGDRNREIGGLRRAGVRAKMAIDRLIQVELGRGRAMATETTDVVIVGVGAAGAVLAAELSKAGMKVVGLERGPRLSTNDFKPRD